MMSAKEILKRLKKLDCPPEERYSHYPEVLKIVVNLPNIFVRKEFPYNQVCGFKRKGVEKELGGALPPFPLGGK